MSESTMDWIEKYNIQLLFNRETKNFLELEIRNTDYFRSKKRLSILSLLLLLVHCAFSSSILVLFVDMYLAIVLFRLLNLKDNETFKVIRELGIEKTTKFSFNRKSQIFVPYKIINSVVINEIICAVSFAAVWNVLDEVARNNINDLFYF